MKEIAAPLVGEGFNIQIIKKGRHDFINMFAEGIVDYLCEHRAKDTLELYLRAEKSGQLRRIMESL
jgi:hypothetical protein